MKSAAGYACFSFAFCGQWFEPINSMDRHAITYYINDADCGCGKAACIRSA